MTKRKASVVAMVWDFVRLISQPFNAIPAKFNSKLNPVNNRKLITNIPAQILADKPRSFVVTYILPDGKKKVVKRVGYQPVCLPDGSAFNADGSPVREGAGDFMSAYRLGQFKTKAVAEKTFWSLLSYFLVSVTRGQLPTPEKMSGASTIRSRFVDYWLNETGIKIESLKLVGKAGQAITYNPQQVESILALFRANADTIFETWNDTVRGGKSDFVISI